MERLILGLLILSGGLVSCAPGGKAQYDSWTPEFSNAPGRFGQAVTALWISRYQEDPLTLHFVRTSAWGEIPEKLVPDGRGGFTVAVPLLVQGESSDGPFPDRFQTVVVRLIQEGSGFALTPNDALPGEVVGWVEASRRTVWLRGRDLGPTKTLWQFRGRY